MMSQKTEKSVNTSTCWYSGRKRI